MTTDHENALDRLMSTWGPEVVGFWREGSPRNSVSGTLVGTTVASASAEKHTRESIVLPASSLLELTREDACVLLMNDVVGWMFTTRAWKPVGNILEAVCTILLVYAQRVKWFREGRPIPKIVHGSQICCSTGYEEVVLFPPPLCGN